MTDRIEGLSWSVHQIYCDLLAEIEFAEGVSQLAWLLSSWISREDPDSTTDAATSGLYQAARVHHERLREVSDRLRKASVAFEKMTDEQPAA